MKNKKIVLVLSCLMLITFIGCSNNSKTQTTSNDITETTSLKHIKVKLTAQLIFNKFKKTEKTNITNIEIVTAENDTNHFLGRPNQYTEKICWNDGRIKDSQTVSSIELFNNKEDAATRKAYIEHVTKAMPVLTQYLIQKDNILLRIESGLTPAQSEEYIKIFKAI